MWHTIIIVWKFISKISLNDSEVMNKDVFITEVEGNFIFWNSKNSEDGIQKFV